MRETLIVVTSDHGEEIFEHGACTHQQPYEETARVPLVFVGPGIPAGRRVREIVELVDLAPTILSLLSLEPPALMQGRDLSPLITANGAPPEPRGALVDGILGGVPHLLARYPSNLILELEGGTWSYVNTVYEVPEGEGFRFETREPGELYLLDQDPEQRVDRTAGQPQLAERLRGELLARYAANEALARELLPRRAKEGGDEGPMLGEEELEQLRRLGYAD
jgi:arylsulfatase A-like enzyme